MPKPTYEEEGPPSGLRESGPCLAQPPIDDPLTHALFVALAYWPSRWPRAVVVAALALEPMAVDLEPQQWTELLDKMSCDLGPTIKDATPFP